jgi:hypothetical protein
MNRQYFATRPTASREETLAFALDATALLPSCRGGRNARAFARAFVPECSDGNRHGSHKVIQDRRPRSDPK